MMIQFLAIQIRLGRITLADVPEKYRADVGAWLEAENV